MIYKQNVLFIVLFTLTFAIPKFSFATETYAINNEKVLLLYKFINWWYDCPSEKFEPYCGRQIIYKTTGSLFVNYNKDTQKLALSIDDGFEPLISIFNQDKKKSDRIQIKLTCLNETYFESESATVLNSKKQILKLFEFTGVNPTTYQTLKDLEEGLGIELEGYIYGIINGKLALYPSNLLQRTCREDLKRFESKESPINVRLFNSFTDETLASYSILNR